MRKVLLCFCFAVFYALSLPAKTLDVSQAFSVNLSAAEDRFDIDFILGDENIFIYKNSFSVLANGKNITDELSVPNGVNKGNYSIIKHDFSLLVPFSVFTTLPATLTLNYQGCAESGICYRPQVREFSITSSPNGGLKAELSRLNGKNLTSEPSSKSGFVDKISAIFSGELGSDSSIASSLEGSAAIISALVFFAYGLALSFTPCVLPMVPILSGIIVARGGRGAFVASAVYVLAMALAYAGLGVVVSLLGGGVQAWLQNEWVLGAMAIIFVLLALSMFGVYEIRMPSFAEGALSRRGGLLGVAAMGVLSTLVLSPCVAAPLAGALIFIARSGDVVFGALMLFVMGLGMGVPLLALGASSGKWLPKPGEWMEWVKSAFGFVMLAVAVWLAGRIIGDSAVLVLWGVLGLFAVVKFNSLKSLGWVFKGTLLVLGLYFAVLFVGGLAGARDFTTPLKPFTNGAKIEQKSELSAVKVTNLNELKSAINSANGKVIVDFWASWCVSCIELDEKTFSNPEVISALKGFTIIKADVSDGGAASDEMMRAFEVVGPPAILFFKDLAELKEHRMSGFVPPKSMLKLLNEIR